MHFIRSFTVLLLVFYVGVMPCLAKEADPKIVAEIKEVMDKHAIAIDKKDISTIMKMYAQDHHTVWMASRPGDLWVGKENIKAAYLEFFNSIDREVVSYNWVNSQ